ncbi:exonuclease SbcCD subunit D [Macrococcoides canis]|uniref:exonuclease SbcCD subunit D n=1 Tax=Macrococcoides canis TaxID=1855823 RepID=UPI0022B8E504|nr:exonuclease SbcCD subunit D [Macrococcus canis]WBF51845.1 exonuclease SbcCD subunit D [Macrococcus canis]
MRIMHLGDLHIGKTINQQSLLHEQSILLNRLIEDIQETSIDVLVIAGDIYDRSIPSREAMKIYETFIYEVNQIMKIPVLVVSGNHDSAERLGYGKAWYKGHELYIGTTIDDALYPVSIDDVDFYLVPYIEPVIARQYFEDDSIRTHHDTYKRIIEQIEQRMNKDRKNIMVSHLFVAGGKTSESEREIIVGTIENVSLNLFNAFDYVMLGHLHTPDAIHDEKVFYSGSIMKYSFDEVYQRKGYRIFDLDQQQVNFVALSPPRDLQYATGTYEDAIKMKLGVDRNSYLKLELSEMEHINDPMFKLKQVYPYLLELKPVIDHKNIRYQQKEVQHLSHFELVQQFYVDMTESEMDNTQKNLIEQLINESRVMDETD